MRGTARTSTTAGSPGRRTGPVERHPVVKAHSLFTGGVRAVVETAYHSIEYPELRKKSGAGGVDKFEAHGVSVEATKATYGTHADVVRTDIHETDDLSVSDYNDRRVHNNYSFKEPGPPVHFGGQEPA